MNTGKAINSATQCLTDSFSLTGPAGSVPPVICGTVSGEHGKTKSCIQLLFCGNCSSKDPSTLRHFACSLKNEDVGYSGNLFGVRESWVKAQEGKGLIFYLYMIAY